MAPTRTWPPKPTVRGRKWWRCTHWWREHSYCADCEYEGAHIVGAMFADTHSLILRGISRSVSWFFNLWYKDSSQFRLFIPICLSVLLGYAAKSVSVVFHQSFYPNVLSNIVCVHLIYLVITAFQFIPNTFIQNMIYVLTSVPHFLKTDQLVQMLLQLTIWYRKLVYGFSKENWLNLDLRGIE